MTYLQAMKICKYVRCTQLAHLCCDVGVLLPVPVAVVGVDVVAAHDPVHRLQHHAAVVIGDHIGVSETENGEESFYKIAGLS